MKKLTYKSEDALQNWDWRGFEGRGRARARPKFEAEALWEGWLE